MFLGCATAKGRARLARALYLPKEWGDNADRREGVGALEEVAFATQIVLVPRLIDL